MSDVTQLQDEIRQLKAQIRVKDDEIEQAARNITGLIQSMEKTRDEIEMLKVQAQ